MASGHRSPLPSVAINEMLDSYVETCEGLIKQCQQLELKDGRKLEKKCRAELKYLLSLKKRKKTATNSNVNVKEHDLKSSNLSHFAAILHAINHLPNVVKILSPFSTKDRTDSLIVDVVAQNGLLWMKVIARKAQALHLIWAGKGQFGDRDIIRQAEDYTSCANQHPVNFVVPKVHYAFYNEVTYEMAEALERLGVTVWGRRIPIPTELERLVDESLNMSDSDKSECEYNNDDYFTGDFNGDESEDDCDILSASELMSKTSSERLKHSGVEINEPVGDICDKSGKKKCYVESEITGINAKTCDLFFKDDSKTSKPCDKSEQCKTVSKAQCNTLIRSEESVLDILSSAPVYRFDDMTIRAETINNSQLNDPCIDTSQVNLDITTMITLVSNITHGGCKYTFKEKILSMQAEEERMTPVLPELERYLEGKQFFVCQTAVDDFQTILDTLGGDNEKQRAIELLSKCQIVPDQPSEQAKKLPNTGKIRERSKIIFGTGDQLKCVTVSANSGFVRAAEHQGLTFAVYLHQSRALTERKQIEITSP